MTYTRKILGLSKAELHWTSDYQQKRHSRLQYIANR